MLPNFTGLLAFVEAARLGSLSAAARKLDLTPAAISRNVLRLEAELGLRLFNRSTRRLRLTAEGEAFLQQVEPALRTLEAAADHAGAAGALPAGKVRISVGASFGRQWVVPALPGLLAQYPALQVEVDLENRPVDLVGEGFDIGIRGGMLRDSSLVARRICALPLVLVASPAYLARAGVPRRVGELEAHAAIVVRFPSGTQSSWEFVEQGQALEFAPRASLVVSEPEAALDLALAGAGIVQSGLHHTWGHLQAGRLKLVLAGSHQPGTREIALHYPHRQHLAPRVRATVDHLLAHFAATPALQVTRRDALPFAA